MIDMGNPLFNQTVEGFLKIGTMGASHVVVEETYQERGRTKVMADTHNVTSNILGDDN